VGDVDAGRGAQTYELAQRGQRSPARRLVGPTIATAIMLAILLSLGFWQVRRLAWKEDLLARIHARIHAPPQSLPPEASWPALKPHDYQYRHVHATGVFENNKEAQVFIGTGGGRHEGAGPGYFVLTPLRLANGAHVIVNRGFVPLADKDPSTRAAGQIAGPTTVTGLMRSPEGRNLFTPADNPAKESWFTRDPAEIARYYRLARTAPFMIDADATKSTAPGSPAGGATVVAIPNNHFSYAVTWFGLAAGLLAVFGVFVWRILHGD